jgi:hypothetical protein
MDISISERKWGEEVEQERLAERKYRSILILLALDIIEIMVMVMVVIVVMV